MSFPNFRNIRHEQGFKCVKDVRDGQKLIEISDSVTNKITLVYNSKGDLISLVLLTGTIYANQLGNINFSELDGFLNVSTTLPIIKNVKGQSHLNRVEFHMQPCKIRLDQSVIPKIQMPAFSNLARTKSDLQSWLSKFNSAVNLRGGDNEDTGMEKLVTSVIKKASDSKSFPSLNKCFLTAAELALKIVSNEAVLRIGSVLERRGPTPTIFVDGFTGELTPRTQFKPIQPNGQFGSNGDRNNPLKLKPITSETKWYMTTGQQGASDSAPSGSFKQVMQQLVRQRAKKTLTIETSDQVYTVKNPDGKIATLEDLQDRVAETIYDAIRECDTDICDIAENLGCKADNIKKVKDHLFYATHELDSYVSLGEPSEYKQFDANFQQALAWKRLESGTHTQDDITWIKHECAERHYELKFNSGYSAAHKRAQSKYDGYPWSDEF